MKSKLKQESKPTRESVSIKKEPDPVPSKQPTPPSSKIEGKPPSNPPKGERKSFFSARSQAVKREGSETSAKSLTASNTKKDRETKAEDSLMIDVSSDEQDDYIDTSVIAKSTAFSDAKRIREGLRDMMDVVIDVPMRDADDDVPELENTHSAEADAISDITKASMDAVEEGAATVAIVGGRRRGRRRVMKKKTSRNEEGYLG
jgi:DNA polymerase delta subunit 3